jgi:hypothetical protein
MMLSAQCRPGTPVSGDWQKTVYYSEIDCRSDVTGALLPREMLEKLEQGELGHTREEKEQIVALLIGAMNSGVAFRAQGDQVLI